nr:MAG TPA: hypothetical protein [Caudoviricetes sp.]
MFKINSNNCIFLTRGDSATLNVDVSNADGTAYTPTGTVKLYFSVKKSVNDTNYVLQKIITDLSESISITPSDTTALDCGNYQYDVEMHDGEKVYTIIPPTQFTLGTEVTQE